MRLNQWQFIGHLGADPEERFAQSGTRLLNFRVAVNADRKRGDEWEQNTLWVRVTCIGDRFSWLAERLSKGSPVFVQGKLDVSTYEGKDGESRWSLEVLANDVQLLEKRTDGGTRQDHWAGSTTTRGNQPAAGNGRARQPARPAAPAVADDPDDMEDLPF